VAGISVQKEEKSEETAKEDSCEELKRDAKEKAESKDHEKKEIPLEKMTKAQLREKIKEAQELGEKNYDLYIRSQAEMDNMKKRFRKEKDDLVKFSNDSLIRQLLGVVDNLEKAVSHSQDENSTVSLREGVELTLKGLMDILEKSGVERLEAVGHPFDPNFHEAMSEQEDNTVKPGTVLQEFQKGYILKQRLLRPAMVIVSKGNA